ncbi:recombinase family protein [Ancylobacter sp. 6x-1]|uniref:Recombinase family protein n=1 Tax=Ancylobacter crimeensis TaxID=2579147 RepID=A0ABT0DBS2_9HYPH|nr:recombinase family protein [Ancylobacter crimeensis]
MEEIFSRPIYAGRITIPEWDLHLIPAKHEALVSFETWQAVQRRRQGTAVAPVRKDINEDFPLRGFVTCGHCNQPMTACWSKGRSAYYPYYLCDTRGCVAHRKSVRRETIEGDFEKLLAELTPSEELFVLAFEMFRDLWNARTNAAQSDTSALKRDLAQIEKKVAQFLDRIVETDNRSVIAAYEARIRDLETEKALVAEKIGRSGKPVAMFDETYRTAFSFLANPCNLWASDRLEDKRAVLRLVFAERLPYVRGEGYRTAKTSLPFRALGDFRMGKYEMVRVVGLEPTLCHQKRILSPLMLE